MAPSFDTLSEQDLHEEEEEEVDFSGMFPVSATWLVGMLLYIFVPSIGSCLHDRVADLILLLFNRP